MQYAVNALKLPRAEIKDNITGFKFNSKSFYYIKFEIDLKIISNIRVVFYNQRVVCILGLSFYYSFLTSLFRAGRLNCLTLSYKSKKRIQLQENVPANINDFQDQYYMISDIPISDN